MSLFHRHDWEVIASQRGEETWAFAKGGSDVTIVLLRCSSCGNLMQKVFNGHWTLSQLRGDKLQVVKQEVLK